MSNEELPVAIAYEITEPAPAPWGQWHDPDIINSATTLAQARQERASHDAAAQKARVSAQNTANAAAGTWTNEDTEQLRALFSDPMMRRRCGRPHWDNIATYMGKPKQAVRNRVLRMKNAKGHLAKYTCSRCTRPKFAGHQCVQDDEIPFTELWKVARSTHPADDQFMEWMTPLPSSQAAQSTTDA